MPRAIPLVAFLAVWAATSMPTLVHAAKEAGAKVESGVYSCDADWNKNGKTSENADVVACIQSALGAITTKEDGTDNTVTVKLPGGYFDVSSACREGKCFELKGGIHILGEMPRLRYIQHEAPDLVMEPNGGTWLDPGPTNTLFTGRHLRGVVLEKFGVANFGKIASFGADGHDGIAFSTIRDVYGVGASRHAQVRSTTAWELYNIQHVRMDHVKVYGVARGLHIIGQYSAWQPANSVISDFYVYTYPNPKGGIMLEVLKPSGPEAEVKQLNYVTFIRPQVNAFSSTFEPGTTGIWLKGFSPGGPVQLMWIIGADVEGELEVAIRLEQADHNFIEIAATPASKTGILLDSESQFNTIFSAHDRVKVDIARQNLNVFHGQIDSTDENLMRGLYWDRADNRWSLSLGSRGRIRSGSGYVWYDDINNRWRVKEGVPNSQSDGQALLTGTGASATRGPVIWTDADTPCSKACTASGMADCVDAWVAGRSVDCFATAGRRACFCR